MLHIIKSLTDPLIEYIKDDPVRPEIPAEWRVTSSREVFVLLGENKQPTAIVCVAYCKEVPDSVATLYQDVGVDPNIAVFYTIWSYTHGAGRDLITKSRQYLGDEYSHINRYITLSPTTEMARQFHIKNGASVFRTNTNTVNYQYG